MPLVNYKFSLVRRSAKTKQITFLGPDALMESDVRYNMPKSSLSMKLSIMCNINKLM